MNGINHIKCIRIAQEIGELLETRKVTVSEAKHILKTVIGHADDHTKFLIFHVHLDEPVLMNTVLKHSRDQEREPERYVPSGWQVNDASGPKESQQIQEPATPEATPPPG